MKKTTKKNLMALFMGLLYVLFVILEKNPSILQWNIGFMAIYIFAFLSCVKIYLKNMEDENDYL